MRRTTAKIMLQSFSFFLFVTIMPIYSANDSGLTSYFQKKSIPVFSITRVLDAVIVKIRYQKLGELNEDKLESDQLMILQKIGTSYPDSKTIRLEYYAGKKLILGNEYKTDNAIQFSKGARDKTSLLADASVSIESGMDALFLSDPPPGWALKEDVIELEPAADLNPEPQRASYLGVQIAPIQPTGLQVVNVYKNSPAKHAGLHPDDIILEIEGQIIHFKESETTELARYMASLPADRPLRFHIERQGERFDIWIKLTDIAGKDLEELREKTDLRFRKIYEDALQAQINQDYDKAIGLYNKTIDVFPLQTYQGLGVCYFFKKYFDDAFYYLAKAYKEHQQSAFTVFFLSSALDNLGKHPEAIFCFESYLLLKDPDKKRQEFARRRLNHLKKKSRHQHTPAYRSIDDIIHAILGDEIKR